MKKRFLVNFFLLFFVNILVKPAWLFADLLVQRSTGQEYGQYFILFNLSVMLNMLLDFGISNFNNRKVAGNTRHFKGYFSRVITIRFGLALSYLLALVVTAFFLSYDGIQIKILIFLGVNQVLLATLIYFRSNLTALGHFKFDSFLSVVDRLVMASLVLGVFFFTSDQFTIFFFIEAQFIGYLCAVLLSFFLVVLKGGFVKPQWNFKFNMVLLKKSYPYALIVALMSAYSYSDSLMLDQMLENGIWENMIYAHSFRVLMASNNYAYLIAVLLLPMFSKMIKKKQDVRPLLRLSGSLLIFGICCLAVMCKVFSQELINLLYAHYEVKLNLAERLSADGLRIINEEEVVYSARVFACLLLGIVPMSFNYVYGVLLTAGGKMKVLNVLALVALTANLVLNSILIPTKGALGAALASVITQGICALGQCYYCYKVHHIDFSVKHFLKFIGAIIFLYFGGNFVKNEWEFIHALGAYMLFALVLIFSLKLVSWKAVKVHLLKK